MANVAGGRTKSTTAKNSGGKLTAKATSQTLAAANPGRYELYVCNPSTKEVWLALGETATKEQGIWLRKESGSVVISGYTGIVSAVTSEGEGLVTFAEI